MKSIIQDDLTKCYLCGAKGTKRDIHHVFGGNNRELSERYGLTVSLCHDKCHIFGRNSVHQNTEINSALKAQVQRRAMNYYKWSVEEFRAIFGKNYL